MGHSMWPSFFSGLRTRNEVEKRLQACNYKQPILHPPSTFTPYYQQAKLGPAEGPVHTSKSGVATSRPEK